MLASAAEWLRIQMKLLLLAHLSPPAARPGFGDPGLEDSKGNSGEIGNGVRASCG